MNPLDILKANFAVNLEKQGHSLHDLEDALTNMDNPDNAKKAADLLKVAFLDKINPIDIGSKATSFGGKAYLAGILGGGVIGGNALDAADESVGEDNNRLKVMREKIKLLHKLTHKVTQENA